MRMALLLPPLVLVLTAYVAGQSPDSPKKGEQLHARSGSDVTSPQPVLTSAPEYPNSAQSQQKITGTVVLEVIVGTDGRIYSPKVVRSLSPELDAAAIKKVSSWKLKPARKDGHPVAVQMIVDVHFDHGKVTQ
jgi:TonB family protein